MKLIIDIDDDLYTRLFDAGENTMRDMEEACSAIRHGDPLIEKYGDVLEVEK